MEVILGRSSSNHIAIRSEKASRQHARIWSSNGGWMIEDLGSRNGTFVNGEAVESRALSEGDKIEIAGFSLEFVHRIQAAEGPVQSSLPPGATDDQLTMAMESAAITARRDHSDFFRGDSAKSMPSDASRATLLQLAFELAGAESAAQAFELVLDRIEQSIPHHCIGGYVHGGKKGADDDAGMNLIATRQSKQTIGSTSYRPPAAAAISSVVGPEGQAILARNVAGDRALATENSQGEIDAVSMILVPVRDRERNLLGMLHLLTVDSHAVYTETELEFALAIAEILAESLRNLRVRGKLDRSLRRTQRQVKALKEQLGSKVEIVGKSAAVQQIIQTVAMAAPTGATVLVRGESGVGKELVASALHHASDRAAGPLICMNCAALSPSLLESELFGHEKGAFTGATDRKRGKVRNRRRRNVDAGRDR